MRRRAFLRGSAALPADAGWALVAEYGGDDPGDVAEVTVRGTIRNVSGERLDVVQAFATLWIAEDRALATAHARREGVGAGATWRFEAGHRLTAHSGHLLAPVTDDNEVTVPYVTGATSFGVSGGA